MSKSGSIVSVAVIVALADLILLDESNCFCWAKFTQQSLETLGKNFVLSLVPGVHFSTFTTQLKHFLYCSFQLWQIILENIPDTVQIHT
jgi:hypothetical protein